MDFHETCTISPNQFVLSSTSMEEPGFSEFSVQRNVPTPSTINQYIGKCADLQASNYFKHLDTIQTSLFVGGQHPNSCNTTDFVPDDAYVPLPASRPQICVFGARLVEPLPGKFGALFPEPKQVVAFGFDTTFRFIVSDKSEYCRTLQEQPSQGAAKKCISKGGRGFAFVIQNAGSPGHPGGGYDQLSFQINVATGLNIGYNFPQNVAIEFDYFFDPATNDPNWNHVAVMVPTSRDSFEATSNSNSADHAQNMLAIADSVSLPPLDEGSHKVRIKYDVSNSGSMWQEMISNQWLMRPLTQLQQQMLTWWSYGRIGTLTVFLDDTLIIKTFLDISAAVHVDSIFSPTPGAAWVGFVASTGPSSDQLASPIIQSWTWDSSHSSCTSPPPSLTCLFGHNVDDISSTNPRPGGESDVQFYIRNIARSNLKIFATTQGGAQKSCSGSTLLAWNQIHPYYAGCQYPVSVGPNLQSILITDESGSRTVTVEDPQLINRDFQSSLFIRQSVPEYCIIEHQSDYYKLFFGQCNCAYCVRIFDNQRLYSVFYNQICSQRYTFSCKCFEVSQMTTNAFATDYLNPANPWKTLTEPSAAPGISAQLMQYQEHTVCRGCSFDYHCNFMLPTAACDTPTTIYRIGNPLEPVPGGSFQNWNRGRGAEDGIIKGNACNCLDRSYEPEYLNSRNQQVHVSAYLSAYLPKTADECLTRLKIGGDASEDCGYPVSVNLLHYPNGQACSTCTLSSLGLMNIPTIRYTSLRDCVYSAIKEGLSPWSQCATTVGEWTDVPDAQTNPQTVLNNLLNGIATHYLTECPGLDFQVRGAVCAPNMYAVGLLPMQMITEQSAKVQRPDGSYPIWWDGVACMNAMCQLTPKSACYRKLIKIMFRQDPATLATTCYDLLGSQVGCTLVNTPGFDSSSNSIIFDRSAKQFGYTDSLPIGSWSLGDGGLKSKTLEVWAKVASSDIITDMVAPNVNGLSASNSWGDDYVPSKAVSISDLTTYWHSRTSSDANFEAIWEINFGPVAVKTVQSINLIFHELPPDTFTVEASVDGGTSWKVVNEFTGNNLLAVSSASFFKFNAIRLVMTKAAQSRSYGIDQGKFAYAMAGFGAFSNLEVSRLKPTQATQHYTYNPQSAFDNSYSSWWSVPRQPNSVAQGWISLAFPNVVSNVVLVRLVYRLGYNPSTITTTIAIGNGGILADIVCTAQNPTCVSGQVSVSTPETQFSLSSTMLTGVRIDVTGPSNYFDDSIVQISEIEIYQQPGNSPTNYSPTSCGNACSFPLALTGPTTQSFSAWNLPIGDLFGIFTISLVSYAGTGGPATVSLRSPSTYSATPLISLGPIGTLSFTFSSLIQQNSDLTMVLTVPTGTVLTISTITVSSLSKVDITTLSPTVTASISWVDTISPVSSVSPQAATAAQGSPNNMFDLDRWTEFRTKIGAPSFVGSLSSNPDFVLTTNITRVINIDAIFLSFSYRSRWFRFRTKSLVTPNVPDAVCEWVPSMSTNTGGSCANSVTSVLPTISLSGTPWKNTNPYGFVFSQNPLGRNLPTNTFDLTLKQSSAVDSVGNNQPIIGIRELAIYSAYETVKPSLCSVSPTFQNGNGLFSSNACAGELFDKNFTSIFTATSGSTGSYYLDFDLGSAHLLKDFTIYWGPSASSVPTQIRIYSSNTPTGSVCNVSAAATDFSYLITSPTAPVVYSEPSGYIERPVRCFRISFDSMPSSGSISIAEISIRLAEASFGAHVADSSLANPSYVLDPVSVTAATANSTNGLLNHYIMIDLNSPKTFPPNHSPSSISPDVWGLYMVFTATSQLDQSSIKLYACDPNVGTGTLTDCVTGSQTMSVSVPFATVTSLSGFVFGPLNCLGCNRVAITFNALAGSAGTNLFSIGTINVFASFNQALFGGITAALAAGDTRGWDYTPEKAVDGDSGTAWVSEPDVNSAELVVSLIPEGPFYDPLSTSYIATQSSLVAPTHVATISVNFLYPMIEFAIDSSTDGNSWTERLHRTDSNGASAGGISDLLYANYIRVRLIRAFPVQSPLSLTDSSQSSWFSTLMGVTSVSATILTNLATGSNIATVASVNTAVAYGINTPRWMTIPPGPVVGKFSLTVSPSFGLDISGIEIQWYFPPSSFSVTSYDKNGLATSLILHSRTATAPLTAVYGSTQFITQVAYLTVQIDSFSALDGISMALMKQIIVSMPNLTSKLSVQSVSASTSANTANLIDGNLASVWTNLGTPSTVSITLAGGNNLVSTITIVWGANICSSFSVSGTPVGASSPTLIASYTSNTLQTVSIRLLSTFQTITVDMVSNVGDVAGTLPSFTIAEISVYGANTAPFVSASQLSGPSPNFDSPDFAIDNDPATSMWMVSPGFNYMSGSATITVTLGTVYKASAIQVIWGWTPWDPTTLNIANQLRQYVVFTDAACSYTNPLNYEHIELGFSIVDKTDLYSESVFLKCLSIIINSGAPYFGGSVLGPSIKDISITFDQNLIQGQQEYVDDTQPGGWWDFPANLMADEATTTAWISKKQSTSAEIRLELGQQYNLAGIDISFLYPAGEIRYSYSQQSCASTTTFIPAADPVPNTGLTTSLSGLDVQFVARCVRIVLSNPLTKIQNPDAQFGPQVNVFGVTQFYVYHMVGGGGVFGIEAKNPSTGVWGTIFDSIAFGPYQPDQWHMLSESQSRSGNVNGPFIKDETQSMVQIVATFSSNTVTIYRNGMSYGSSYISNGLLDWSTVGDVRLVFGLASSQFASPATQTDINTVLGSPPKKTFNLDPYFAGSIQSMTLLSQALSAEEVMGLYLAQSDYTKERACHCYDACPTGSNQFYPSIPVPCSGQGVCLRQYDSQTGLPANVAGVCQCSPGFSGVNCQTHCSDTAGGCCTVDDDCPVGTTCNTSTNYCQP